MLEWRCNLYAYMNQLVALLLLELDQLAGMLLMVFLPPLCLGDVATASASKSSDLSCSNISNVPFEIVLHFHSCTASLSKNYSRYT